MFSNKTQSFFETVAKQSPGYYGHLILLQQAMKTYRIYGGKANEPYPTHIYENDPKALFFIFNLKTKDFEVCLSPIIGDSDIQLSISMKPFTPRYTVPDDSEEYNNTIRNHLEKEVRYWDVERVICTMTYENFMATDLRLIVAKADPESCIIVEWYINSFGKLLKTSLDMHRVHLERWSPSEKNTITIKQYAEIHAEGILNIDMVFDAAASSLSVGFAHGLVSLFRDVRRPIVANARILGLITLQGEDLRNINEKYRW
jgi:hypothetical protein